MFMLYYVFGILFCMADCCTGEHSALVKSNLTHLTLGAGNTVPKMRVTGNDFIHVFHIEGFK